MADPAVSPIEKKRIGGLRRFAIAITVLNLLGHTVLGFEQAWLHPLVALAAAYAMELMIETVDAWSTGRVARYRGGIGRLVDFVLSAHITGLAVSMLLYANERFWVVAFAAALAIASKAILRAPVGGGAVDAAGRRRTRHFLNPSNFGIAATLLLFPWVGIAPPYQFTENISGMLDWVLPALIVLSGTFLNWRFTGRLPLIAAWVGGFFLQAVLRANANDLSVASALLPMSGLAFVLFTFYMVTDPATTPSAPRTQVLFGLAVAAVYGVLMQLHIVFGLFFSLAIVTGCRGSWMYYEAWAAERGREASVFDGTAPAGVVGAGERK